MSYVRCQQCQQRASMRMAQHRLNLCKDHYLEWILKQTDSTIQKYHMFGKKTRVLAAVSGGKDSLALWDVLWRLGYQVDGFYIDLGINEGCSYSTNSKKMVQEFADSRGLGLIIIDVKEKYGENIPELTRRTQRGMRRTCSVCGQVKRHIMNETAREGGYDVVATGHNLDDEAAVLFSNTLGWNQVQLLRQSPFLPSRAGMPAKVKPFFRFYERETAAYALLRGISYIYEECPFVEGSTSLLYKNILNQMEDTSPGTKMRFLMNYLKARESGFFQEQAFDEQVALLHSCPQCGQATTNEDLCAFCKLMEQ